jgi:N-acetylmuramic acid 6-phosphate etherase
VLDASECPPTFQSDPSQVVGLIAGGDGALRRSSERREDEFDGAAADFEAIGLRAGDTFLGIAAGGTTPWVLGGLRLAKARGAATGMLVCSPRDCPPDCDRLIVLDTGPEILSGSTRLKAGSATKLAAAAAVVAMAAMGAAAAAAAAAAAMAAMVEGPAAKEAGIQVAGRRRSRCSRCRERSTRTATRGRRRRRCRCSGSSSSCR